MHPEHTRLLEALKGAVAPVPPHGFDLESYLGGSHPALGVKVPDRRRIAKDWLKAHRDLSPAGKLEVVESLFAGKTHEEKTLAALMLEADPKLRAAVGPHDVERWLQRLTGWGEVDSLCQGAFTPREMLAAWPAWSAAIERLTASANPNQRRGALVLLTCATRRSDDPRPRDLAFRTIEALKAETAPLITKAISWLLRSLLEHHRAAVEAYLAAEADSLPKIAVRETRTKMLTGKK